jgi:hypothetical protein
MIMGNRKVIGNWAQFGFYSVFIFLIIAALQATTTVHAQIAEVLIDDSNGIAGFDLYNNSLNYWQNNSTSCPGPNNDTLYRMPYRFDPASPAHNRVNACNSIRQNTSIVRDDANFYCASAAKQITRHVYHNNSKSAYVTNTSLSNTEITSLAIHEGFLYYAASNTSNTRLYAIYRVPTGKSPAVDVGELVGSGGVLAVNTNFVNKMELSTYGLWMTGWVCFTWWETPPLNLARTATISSMSRISGIRLHRRPNS